MRWGTLISQNVIKGCRDTQSQWYVNKEDKLRYKRLN